MNREEYITILEVEKAELKRENRKYKEVINKLKEDIIFCNYTRWSKYLKKV